VRERLATLRILIGAYACIYIVLGIGEIASVASLPASRFAPVGIVRVLDQPLPVWLVTAIAIMTAVLLAGFVAGIAYRIVAPLAAIGLLWTLCYRSSWGMIFHTDDLLVLHVIALAMSPAADARALGRPSRDGGHYDFAVKAIVALTVITYVLAGIAKLRIAGLHWLSGDLLRDQIAFDRAAGDPAARPPRLAGDRLDRDARHRARRSRRPGRGNNRPGVGGCRVDVPCWRRPDHEHLVSLPTLRVCLRGGVPDRAFALAMATTRVVTLRAPS
jgi:hypothetical protein